MLFTILALGLIAAGGWFWKTRNPASPVPSPISPANSTLHLETFVLNLADPGQRSYLRIGIDLGLGHEIGKDENAPPIAQLRDTILGVLGEARVDELVTADGKLKLKQDLLRALREKVPGQAVEQVYFTEFLIQR